MTDKYLHNYINYDLNQEGDKFTYTLLNNDRNNIYLSLIYLYK